MNTLEHPQRPPQSALFNMDSTEKAVGSEQWDQGRAKAVENVHAAAAGAIGEMPVINPVQNKAPQSSLKGIVATLQVGSTKAKEVAMQELDKLDKANPGIAFKVINELVKKNSQKPETAERATQTNPCKDFKSQLRVEPGAVSKFLEDYEKQSPPKHFVYLASTFYKVKEKIATNLTAEVFEERLNSFKKKKEKAELKEDEEKIEQTMAEEKERHVRDLLLCVEEVERKKISAPFIIDVESLNILQSVLDRCVHEKNIDIYRHVQILSEKVCCVNIGTQKVKWPKAPRPV